MKTKLFRVSIAINIFLVLFFIGRRLYMNYYYSPQIIEETKDEYNEARVSIFNSLPIDTNDIVFIGTSITEGFPLEESFQSLHVKNRGISDNRSIEVLNRIDFIVMHHPKKIFLEVGVNDIKRNVLPDTLFSNYAKIVSKIITGSPSTKLYVQSVFPVCREYAIFQKGINSFNQKLKQLCEKQNIRYIGVDSILIKNGELDTLLTFDGIHLNEKGYMLWKNKIKTLVVN